MEKALQKEGRNETKKNTFNDWNAYLAGKCYFSNGLFNCKTCTNDSIIFC